MSDKFAVSLVVPVYNSAAFLQSTITALAGYLQSEFKHYELILVDDGSIDESLAIMRAAADENKNIRLIIHERNLGQQRSLADGFLSARNAIVVSIDADLPCELTDLKKIAHIVYNGSELVFGRRVVQIRRAWWRTFGSFVANLIFRLIYPFEIQDIGCGLLAMRPSLIEKLRNRKKSTGLIKLDLLLAAENCVQMDISNRRSTTSSYSFIKLVKLFWLMLTNRFRQWG
jgi:glycosyltransferase involved in cell wall biosynthesis